MWTYFTLVTDQYRNHCYLPRIGWIPLWAFKYSVSTFCYNCVCKHPVLCTNSIMATLATTLCLVQMIHPMNWLWLQNGFTLTIDDGMTLIFFIVATIGGVASHWSVVSFVSLLGVPPLRYPSLTRLNYWSQHHLSVCSPPQCSLNVCFISFRQLLVQFVQNASIPLVKGLEDSESKHCLPLLAPTDGSLCGPLELTGQPGLPRAEA